jgi:hypothetical protein
VSGRGGAGRKEKLRSKRKCGSREKVKVRKKERKKEKVFVVLTYMADRGSKKELSFKSVCRNT